MQVTNSLETKHHGPSLFILGSVYVALSMSGIIISAAIAGQHYVSPFAGEETILEFFRVHADAVRVQAFFVLVSAIPLCVYAATIVSRLNYFGVRAAGPTIALFGGFGASFVLIL